MPQLIAPRMSPVAQALLQATAAQAGSGGQAGAPDISGVTEELFKNREGGLSSFGRHFGQQKQLGEGGSTATSGGFFGTGSSDMGGGGKSISPEMIAAAAQFFSSKAFKDELGDFGDLL